MSPHVNQDKVYMIQILYTYTCIYTRIYVYIYVYMYTYIYDQVYYKLNYIVPGICHINTAQHYLNISCHSSDFVIAAWSNLLLHYISLNSCDCCRRPINSSTSGTLILLNFIGMEGAVIVMLYRNGIFIGDIFEWRISVSLKIQNEGSSGQNN